MNTIQWESTFEIGVSSVDKQHKALVNLLNGLEVAMSYGDSRQVLGPLLEQFLDYAQRHFEVERALLVAGACPEIEVHQLAHHSFAVKARQLHHRFQFEADFLISVEAVRLLRDWLNHHLAVESCPFARFLKVGAQMRAGDNESS
ncbi:MAG: bacteriohemerythrin [bacterium]|nr:bacteriohemerythrin [bacterium]